MGAIAGPIVVGFDESKGAAEAVAWAGDEARSTGLPLRLVHAYELDLDIPWLLVYNNSAAEVAAVHERHGRLVAAAADEVRRVAPDLTVEHRAVEGRPGAVLCEESARAHLIVVGHRDRRGVGPVIPGSVAARLVTGAACPAVVLRDVPVVEGNVVAGVDGGPASPAVLGFAIDYASRHGLRVTAILCIPPHPSRSLDRAGEDLDQARRTLAEVCAGWRDRYPDVQVEEIVVGDHPVDALVAAAEHERLLVVGSNRSRYRPPSMLGPVANGMLHHAPCAVAVVPTDTADAAR